MGYLLSSLGIIASFYLIKYRERLGDMIGEAEWMKKVGGVYNVIIIFAIFLFFWCIATITGTTNVLFWPILHFVPSMQQAPKAGF